MKTKVVRHYDMKYGVDIFSVYKWSLWDDQELRHYYPDQFDWHYVMTFGDLGRAKAAAQHLSDEGRLQEDVVAVYGSE